MTNLARSSAPADRLPNAHLAEILSLVRTRHGLDLSGYRRGTIERRVRTAMIAAGASTSAAYLDRLRADRRLAGDLLARLTVKVSRFYRDAAAVERVREALAARLAAAPGPLAVWSAGCARGEEPYSLAMILDDLGAPAGPDVVATDVAPDALAAAEVATYPAAALTELPRAYRDRYLTPVLGRGGAGFRVHPAIRARVRALRHDLSAARAPPEPRRFDLVACRNTLIYFQPALQRRALELLLDALAPGALLWLGPAEWPAGLGGGRLEVLDRRARLFRAIGGSADA